MTPPSTPDEVPVFFPAASETLLGMVTRPRGHDLGIGVVLLDAGRYTTSAGRNRLRSRMARRLADRGFHVLRFDYHGVGDSTGVVPEFVLGEPFTDDFGAAAQVLRADGIERIIAVGDCFGARTALAGAALGSPAAAGLVLTLLPWRDSGRTELAQDRLVSEMSVRDYAEHFAIAKLGRAVVDARVRALYWQLVSKKARQLFAGLRNRTRGIQLESWASRTVFRQLTTVLDRGLPTLLVYGVPDGDEHSEDFCALSDHLGPVLRRPTIETASLPVPLGGFRYAQGQELYLDVVEDWITRVAARLRSEPPLASLAS
jgi:pimeloyl-ACP methyl ester carboxylesterase